MRAFVGNASGGSGVPQGGSTLTQQYVKNVFVNARRHARGGDGGDRAQHHAARSRRCATRSRWRSTLTKDQILERYLNIAYFGAGAYGVEAASRRYFSKPASKLTLVEAATLAGAVQQPVAYDPTRNPKSSQKRRIQVLNRMAELGYITPAVAKTAGAIPTTKFLKPSRTRERLHHLVRAVLLRLRLPRHAHRPRLRRDAGRARGAAAPRRSHHPTTLDPAAQEAAQKAVDKHIPRKDKSRKVAAITMVRPDHRRDRRDGAEPLVGRQGPRQHDVQLQRRHRASAAASARRPDRRSRRSPSPRRCEKGSRRTSASSRRRRKTFKDFKQLQDRREVPALPREQLHRLRHVQHDHRHGVLGEHLLHGARGEDRPVRRPPIAEDLGVRRGDGEPLQPRARRSRSAPTRSRRWRWPAPTARSPTTASRCQSIAIAR